MTKARARTTESLARNLRYLMDKKGWSYAQLSEKTAGEVSAKTIGNMLNQVGSPRIDNVDAVARAFGLTGWHLIMPDLLTDLENGTSIARLVEAYVHSSADGRRHIERVADREAELHALEERRRIALEQ